VEETIHVILTRSLQDIIERHGQKAVGFDAYIFPILKEDWTEPRKYAEIKQLTKQVNKYIRAVAKDVGIIDKISSYSARHSWATILKQSGASVEFIKESLGHSSTAVTERYLKSFEKSTRKEQAEKMEALLFKTIEA
jgi:integrase